MTLWAPSFETKKQYVVKRQEAGAPLREFASGLAGPERSPANDDAGIEKRFFHAF
jgi:hypothetical protein